MQWATAALLLVGLGLRAHGFLFRAVPFWEDEAAWAMRLVDLPLRAHTIRPLGFMALSRLLARLFSPSEVVLRAVPWLAGAASVLMAPAIATRLFASSRARLLFIALIALSPGAIDLAKEFKPYSVSLSLHMALLLLTLRYLAEREARDLNFLLATCVVGTLFAQDVVFTYPGLFGLLLLDSFRSRRWPELRSIASAAVVTCSLLVFNYVYFWSKAVSDGDSTTEYWGNKYNVFFVNAQVQGVSHWKWTALKVGDMLAMPGMRRDSWGVSGWSASTLSELREIDANVWQALALLGIALLLLRRRHVVLVLLAAPLATAVLLNTLGRWPLGPFRTNLFTLVYAAAIVAAALDKKESAAASPWDMIPAALLVVAPFLLLAPETHARKGTLANHSEFTAALEALASIGPGPGTESKALLVLDNPSCTLWRYYTQYNRKRAKWRKLDEQFNVQCKRELTHIVSALRDDVRTPKKQAFAMITRQKWLPVAERSVARELHVERALYVGQRDHLILTVTHRS